MSESLSRVAGLSFIGSGIFYSDEVQLLYIRVAVPILLELCSFQIVPLLSSFQFNAIWKSHNYVSGLTTMTKPIENLKSFSKKAVLSVNTSFTELSDSSGLRLCLQSHFKSLEADKPAHEAGTSSRGLPTLNYLKRQLSITASRNRSIAEATPHPAEQLYRGLLRVNRPLDKFAQSNPSASFTGHTAARVCCDGYF